MWDTGFHWGEWLEPGGAPADFGAFVRADKSEVATAYLHRSAVTLVRVAEVLGLPGEQWHRYREIAAGALDAWRREFIRPDGTLAVQ
ncbi:MAG TPA: alpha-L-rhamnosidase, partial [Streptosporangiaceae bacterium]|nr:alpha-L-rhamnosidase [Streptosporangiaceae bacterium]